MKNLLAQIAVFPGRHHMDKDEPIPCQDAAEFHYVLSKTGFREGMLGLADGCGSKPLSHVGAGLSTKAIVHIMPKLVRKYGIRNHVQIGKALHKSVLLIITDYVKRLPGGPKYFVDLDNERRNGTPMRRDNPFFVTIDKLITDIFLTTLLVAYISDEGVLIFRRGDGGFQVDTDQPNFLHYTGEETAPYMAYDLISTPSLLERLADQGLVINLEPRGFSSWFFPDARSVVLATDGVDPGQYDELRGLAVPVDGRPRLNRLYCEIRDWAQSGDTDDMGVGIMINSS